MQTAVREIYVDLAASGDKSVATVDTYGKDPGSLIKVVDLLNKGIKCLSTFPEQYHDVLDEYRERLQSYSFSVILVEEAPIEVAMEIFTRINVSGQLLTQRDLVADSDLTVT